MSGTSTTDPSAVVLDPMCRFMYVFLRIGEADHYSPQNHWKMDSDIIGSESAGRKFYRLRRLWSWQERESNTRMVAQTKLEVKEASGTKPLQDTFVALSLKAGFTKTPLERTVRPGIA